jgi:hypothetical protein
MRTILLRVLLFRPAIYRLPMHVSCVKVEATIGFEPMNKGFADPRVRPLRHVAGVRRDRRGWVVSGWLPLEDSNLG